MKRLLLSAAIVAVALHHASASIVTTTADSGPGSLRAAIANAAPGETITFAVTGAVTLTSDQLPLTTDLNIVGPGADRLAIQRDPAAPAFRIFNVQSTVSISGLSIRNGAADTFNDDNGGGIQNHGQLTLIDCIVENNVAAREYSRGGGILNRDEASLWVTNCVFRQNRCPGDYGEGGGIYVFGEVTVLNSSFLDNYVKDRGAGMHVDYFGAARVSGSTFSGNVVQGREPQGAGIYNYGWLALTNSTLSGNTSFNTGGGIHNDGLSLALRIESCTIVSNYANYGGGIYLNKVWGPRANVIHNSIVAANSGTDIYNRDELISEDYNVIGTMFGQLLAAQPLDQIDVNIHELDLGPLRNNGGTTMTHELLPGSIAFQTGDNVHCLPTDQRGFPRPHYAHCDVGAFEVNNLSPVIQCFSTNVECTSSKGALVTISVILADTDGDALGVIWGPSGAEFQTNYVPAGAPNAPIVVSATRQFSPGLNLIPVLAFDGISESMNCLYRVNVADTTPPTLTSVTTTPRVLTPATHKLVPVKVQVSATDACGPVISRIKSVTSSDPMNGRQADWEITGPLTVNLRAERSSPKVRRIYTITVESSDAAGNKVTGTANVTVPTRKGAALRRTP